MVKEGTFREDLFYRLNVIPIRVPSLRERQEDIPLLVQSFIEKYRMLNGSRIQGIRPDAMSVLMSYSWPGNVRELENVIERAMVLSPGEFIERSVISTNAGEGSIPDVEQMQSDRPTLDNIEERYIKRILKEVNNRKDEAARVLGISRRTLYRKERIYGLVSDDSIEPAEDMHDAIH